MSEKMTAQSGAAGCAPIFVVGYMHSGTTLLLNILKRNSVVFSGRGETKFFDFLPSFEKKYPDLNDDQVLREYIVFVGDIISKGFILNANVSSTITETTFIDNDDIDAIFSSVQYPREHARLLGLVFDHLTRKNGKLRWLEKTPTHIFHIDQIIHLLPGVKFVGIVRDPRAVLASKKVRRETVWTERYSPQQRPLKHLEKAYDPLWDTLSWKSAIAAGLRAKQNFAQSIFTVRYEDLVLQQDKTVREICDFLSLAFEPEMLRVTKRNTAYWQEKDDRAISTHSLSKWQKVLSPAEVYLSQLLVKKEINALGYLSLSTSLFSKLIQPFIFIRSFFEFFLRLSRRYRLGGYVFLSNVIMNYWKRFLRLFSGSRSQ